MEIRVFKPRWTDGTPFCVMARTTANGRETFALAWDRTFPQIIFRDVPLYIVRKNVVNARRIYRRCNISWRMALDAAEKQIARAQKSDPLTLAPHIRVTDMRMKLEQRALWAKYDIDADTDYEITDDVLSKLRLPLIIE